MGRETGSIKGSLIALHNHAAAYTQGLADGGRAVANQMIAAMKSIEDRLEAEAPDEEAERERQRRSETALEQAMRARTRADAAIRKLALELSLQLGGSTNQWISWGWDPNADRDARPGEHMVDDDKGGIGGAQGPALQNGTEGDDDGADSSDQE